jgi:hypothetical protein
METHLSYPVLAHYRSQHHRESWLAALTAVLDVSSLVSVGIGNAPPRAALMALAAARHTAADMSHVLGRRPKWHCHDRLPAADLAHMRALLREAGVPLREGPEVDEQLASLSRMYEPFMSALADELLMPLPCWLPTGGAKDEWQVTLWELAEWETARDGASGKGSSLYG